MKLREEQDRATQEAKVVADGGDAVMKDEEEKTPAIPVTAAKIAQKEEEIKISDMELYREHGVGLDTGNY